LLKKADKGGLTRLKGGERFQYNLGRSPARACHRLMGRLKGEKIQERRRRHEKKRPSKGDEDTLKTRRLRIVLA